MSPIRIAVADKDYLVAQALGRLLDTESDIAVTGTYSDQRSLIRGLAVQKADVVVLDPIGLAPTGITAISSLRAAHPEVHVVVLTASQKEQHLFAAIRAGVRGYVSKASSINEMLRATRAAAEGRATLTPDAALRLMDEFARQSREQTGLTPRQRHLLSGIVQGKTNREIARDVDLSEKTVKNYMSGLFSALGVRDRTEAAICALQDGLISSDD